MLFGWLRRALVTVGSADRSDGQCPHTEEGGRCGSEVYMVLRSADSAGGPLRVNKRFPEKEM